MYQFRCISKGWAPDPSKLSSIINYSPKSRSGSQVYSCSAEELCQAHSRHAMKLGHALGHISIHGRHPPKGPGHNPEPSKTGKLQSQTDHHDMNKTMAWNTFRPAILPSNQSQNYSRAGGVFINISSHAISIHNIACGQPCQRINQPSQDSPTPDI